MTNNGNNGNSDALMIDDNQQVQRVQGTSPTPRSAAYHSDIELVGRSQAFVEVMKQVDLVSNSDSPVWLTGESGTDKEFVAAAIHHRSARNDRPFISIDCAAILADLIEATLFGEQGAGGTVFLDEITQTTPSFQLKLLHLLQTGVLNVRLIAASSCDAEKEVAAGRFSNDLFNALNSVSIVLPPLQDHHEDISTEIPPAVNDDWVTLSEIEGRYVARVLEHTRGNKQAAARVLAVDRKTLDRMIKRHNIDCHHVRAMRAKSSAT